MPPTPNQVRSYLAVEKLRPPPTVLMASFGRNWLLAAPPSPGTVRNQQLSKVGSSGLSSWALATILDPFPSTFTDLGPCPLPDILTPLSFYVCCLSSKSLNGYAHQNRTAILSWWMWSVRKVTVLLSRSVAIDVSDPWIILTRTKFETMCYEQRSTVEPEQISVVEARLMSTVETFLSHQRELDPYMN